LIASNSFSGCTGPAIAISGNGAEAGTIVFRNAFTTCVNAVTVSRTRVGLYENRVQGMTGAAVVYSNGSSGEIVQNLFWSNSFGSIAWTDSTPFILHNTIYDLRGYGLSAGNPPANVLNNIIVGAPALQAAGPGGVATWIGRNVLYSPGSMAVTGVTLPASSGNILGDPYFVSAANGDFQLQSDSPAIDCGSVTNMTERDLAGHLRPVDGNGDGIARPDAGVFEYLPPYLRPPTSLQFEVVGNAAQLTWQADAGATNFIVSRANTVDGPFAPILQTTNTAATDNTLDRYRDYWYIVTAQSPSGTSVASDSLRVRIGNRAPTAIDDSFDVPEDTVVSLTLTANDSDPDGDTFSIVELQGAPPGWLTLTGPGTVQLTPPPEVSTNFLFRYVIADALNSTATGAVSVHVIATNDAPTFDGVGLMTANALSLITHIVDPDSTTFQLHIIRPPVHGELFLDGTNIFYRPVHGFTGPDSFRFTVSDGQAESAENEFGGVVAALDDFDHDQMPDSWENFFDVNNPTADADADGLSNLAEYFADTSPRNAADTLRIKSIMPTAEGFLAVHWSAKGGVRYRVWSAERLTGNPSDFVPVVLPLDFELETASSGTTVERTFVDPRPTGGGERYYRVQVVNE
jgi:hypothetical protein